MEKIKHRSSLRKVLIAGVLLVSNLMTYMVGVYYVSTDTFSSYQLTSDAVRCQMLLRLQHGATSSAHTTWTHRNIPAHLTPHLNHSSSPQFNASLSEHTVGDAVRANMTTNLYSLEKSPVDSKGLSKELGSNSQRDTNFLVESTGQSQAGSEWNTEYESLGESPQRDSVLPPLNRNQWTETHSLLLQAQDTEEHSPMSHSSPTSLSPPLHERTSSTMDLNNADNNELQMDLTPTQIPDMGQCEPCYCNHTSVVYVMEKLPQVSSCTCNQHFQSESSQTTPKPVDQDSNQAKSNTSSKVIFVITPTHKRTSQKIDLTSMCYTLMHVTDLVWIVIEDAPRPTDLVTRLLQRCKVRSVHLVVSTSTRYQVRRGRVPWSKPRGVEQRNAGLNWLRREFSLSNCNGVFYFGDDDNKYDLRLFEEIRQTQVVSVWKVAWAGGLKWEGPTCSNGRAVSWHTAFAPNRKFPIDMAGFAIHLCQLFKHPRAKIGVNVHGQGSQLGYLETDFLQHFTDRSTVECRGSEKETYVWHSHTSLPALHNERKHPTRRLMES